MRKLSNEYVEQVVLDHTASKDKKKKKELNFSDIVIHLSYFLK